MARALGLALTLALAYCWTRAIVGVEVQQRGQTEGGIGLMLLLATGPLTCFFLLALTRCAPAVLALVQALGTGWGWAVLAYLGLAGQSFLLFGALAAAVTAALMIIVQRRVDRGRRVV